jgi:hypothetical protein
LQNSACGIEVAWHIQSRGGRHLNTTVGRKRGWELGLLHRIDVDRIDVDHRIIELASSVFALLFV